MINAEKKNQLMEAFHTKVRENAEANLADLNLKGYCDGGDMTVVRSAVAKIEANVTSAVPAELPTPKASLYTNGTGTGDGAVTVLSLSLTNGWKDPKAFKYSLKVPVTNGDLDQTVLAFLEEAYANLLEDVIANENLEEVNTLLAEVCEMAGVSYRVSIETPLNNNGKKLLDISDTEVVFVADMDRLFALDDVLVLHPVDDLVSEEMIANAKKAMADEIGLCQTTPQLVGAHGGSLVKYISAIGSQVKAITLIRKVASKNVKRLTGKKDTAAYFEDGDVYALMARVDGNLQVVLTPFDVNTLMNVDRDIVAELSA